MDAVEMDAAGNQRFTEASRLPAIVWVEARRDTRIRSIVSPTTLRSTDWGTSPFGVLRAPHKVLRYHFEGADDLLTQAVRRLRDRRISRPGPGDVGGSGARRVAHPRGCGSAGA
jgi:hypothetical protein